MHWRFRICRVSIAAMLWAFGWVPARAATVHLDARTIYERAVSSNITLTADGAALQLLAGEVIQDDGPASGASYKPNIEKLTPGMAIRKQLLIPDPRASHAILMVSHGGELKIEINGKPQTLAAPKGIVFDQWQAYEIDAAALRRGLNDIVMAGTGDIRIARADDSYAPLPHRSARSEDGGKAWHVNCLGPAADTAGEYYVRMRLEHFLPRGSILLPVMDVANLEGKPLAPPLTAAGPVRISFETAPNSRGTVIIRVRSGTTYVPGPKTWSPWEPLPSVGILKTPGGRFVQVELTLSTADPLVTPGLKGITLTTEPQLATDWTKSLKLVDAHNEEIVRTSIPFRYEPFTQPRLKELRTHYGLDDVVAGAKTELDIITKLAAWSARQWKWEEWHLDKFYPKWDALDILRVGTDGKPVGGFCQQYDLVFLQACESFGFVGRDISIGSGTLRRPTVIGHEPMEIWSNQFHKWIWIDGTAAYYPVDSASGVPLSLWEVRQRQLHVLRDEPSDPIRIVRVIDTVHEWRGLDTDMSFAELRLIPRSNFLAQQWPLPLNNGRADWTWTGFQVWTDSDVPAELIHPNVVTRHGNFEWTLDQAHFVLEPTATPGKFLVHLDTETPGFASFQAQLDGGEPAPVKAVFPWKLHRGNNRLKVWPRNIAGRDGIASWVELEMPAR